MGSFITSHLRDNSMTKVQKHIGIFLHMVARNTGPNMGRELEYI